MGARPWHHQTSWHDDPAAALKELQARFIAENYDLAAVLARHLADARSAFASAAADDRYGVLEIHRAEVRLLERLCSQPIPEDFEGQLGMLRAINANTGEGIGNVLDVTSVADQRDIETAELLSPAEMIRVVGTGRPTRADAYEAIGRITRELGRGECVCFPFHDAPGKSQPAGWLFVGLTAD
jgi:hypothetical protein